MALSTLGQQWRFMKDLFYHAFLKRTASVFTTHSFYEPGAPKENIVQNYLNIALLNVF